VELALALDETMDELMNGDTEDEAVAELSMDELTSVNEGKPLGKPPGKPSSYGSDR
jgi:hypothetical protein